MLTPIGHASAHSGAVLALASVRLAGEPWVCSSGYDGAIKLWRLSPSGSLSEEASAIRPGGGAVFSLEAAELADGSALLAAGSYNRELTLRHLSLSQPGAIPTMSTRMVSKLHTGWVRSIAFAARSGKREGGKREGGRSVDESLAHAPSPTLSSRALSSSASEPPHMAFSIGCNYILGWTLDNLLDDSSLGDGAFTPHSNPTPRDPSFELEIREDAVRTHDILCVAHAAETLVAGSVDGAMRAWATEGWLGGGGGARLTPHARACAHWQAHAARVAAVRVQGGRIYSGCYAGLLRCWAPPTPPPPPPDASAPPSPLPSQAHTTPRSTAARGSSSAEVGGGLSSATEGRWGDGGEGGVGGAHPPVPPPWTLASSLQLSKGRVLSLAGSGRRLFCGTSEGELSEILCADETVEAAAHQGGSKISEEQISGVQLSETARRTLTPPQGDGGGGAHDPARVAALVCCTSVDGVQVLVAGDSYGRLHTFAV